MAKRTTCTAYAFCAGDRPWLTLLRSFPSSDGLVDIAEFIGAESYEKFGTCLLNDTLGNMVNNIKHDHRGNVKSTLHQMFTVWLSGKGKRPETWEVFVGCLRGANLNYLADKIESQYSCDDENVSNSKLPSPSSIVDTLTDSPPLSTDPATDVEPTSQTSTGDREILSGVKSLNRGEQR